MSKKKKPRKLQQLPDSGERTAFETGAVRDTAYGKGWPHCIPYIALHKMARRFEDGASKYGVNNWMKGIPLSRYVDAILRHTFQHSEGDDSEDHLGAILWNAGAMAWTEDQIQQGLLPEELDDLPFRKIHNLVEKTTL